jgi:hypothetical protein
LGEAVENGAALLPSALAASGATSSTAVTVFGGETGSSGNAMQLDVDKALEDDYLDEDGLLDLESMLPLDSSELDPEVRMIVLLSSNSPQGRLTAVTHGVVVCVQVLGHLPASVQVELLGKLREQRVYENRRTFERASDNPNAFSKLQMQSYLKTCKFKRKVASVIVRRPCFRPPRAARLFKRCPLFRTLLSLDSHTMRVSCPPMDALLRERMGLLADARKT